MAEVFLDTNVAVDLVTMRQPFYNEAVFIERLAQAGSINMIVSEGSIVTMIYIAFHKYKLPNAEDRLVSFLESCRVTSSTYSLILAALRSTFRDKEDAYQYQTALKCHADYFVTRDKKDFKSVIPYHLPVITPPQLEYMLF